MRSGPDGPRAETQPHHQCDTCLLSGRGLVLLSLLSGHLLQDECRSWRPAGTDQSDPCTPQASGGLPSPHSQLTSHPYSPSPHVSNLTKEN